MNLSDAGPVTLDPAIAADIGSASYVVQVFSGLVHFDETLNVVPDIARSWERSADGRTYTFRLRQDVTFHDGRPVKAGDFKWSWERALNPATGSQTAGTYLNDIVGAEAILAGRATTLSGVSIPDDFTITVAIDAPKAYFLEKMAYPTAFVVDRANVATGPNWWTRANGTGPFKIGQWVSGQLIVLQRNDAYYGEKARLSQVAYKLLSGSPLQQYQEEALDVAQVSPAYLGWATDPSNPVSRELKVFPELSLYYLGFNARKPPFDDVRVRQAFSHAVDRERLVALAMMGSVTAAGGILPPGMPGFNSALKGLAFDPQRAKDLIAQSKYGDVSRLPPIVLTTSGYAGQISGVEGGIIEEWRRNLGVEVTVRQLEPDAFVYSPPEEKDHLFNSGWIADYPDPQDFLELLFRTGQHNNTGGYSNPRIDSVLDRAAVEPDQGTRLRLYQEIEQALVDDAAVLPLFFTRTYVVVKPHVKGYEQSPLGYPLLNKVSIQR